MPLNIFIKTELQKSQLSCWIHTIRILCFSVQILGSVPSSQI